MSRGWRLVPLLASALYGIWSGWRAAGNYAAVPAVPAGLHGAPARAGRRGGEAQGAWPAVSVVIPARDEARNLPRLLHSLRAVAGSVAPAPFEVIVVDDASRDATGELAAALRARVLRLSEGDRPPGWVGKSYACWRGAALANGDWLLFLDADTALEPEALRETLGHAIGADLDALSVLLRQRCHTFWERLLLPFAYQQLFAGVGAAGLTGRDPGGAILNGQFVLIRRAVYDAAGGHRAVAASIVEDMALGRLLTARGYRIATLRGEHLGSVRMYRSLGAVREGFGKNAHAFLAGQPARGFRVALSSACAGATLPLLGEVARRARGDGRGAAVSAAAAGLTWLALGAGLARWMALFGVPRRYAAGQPLAAAVFDAIAVESSLRSLTGRTVAWKGRRYAVGPDTAPPDAGSPAGWLTPGPRVPRGVLLALAGAMARRETFPLTWGSQGYVDRLGGRWAVTGLERIPVQGPLCLVLNHWQRRGLWIGWGGTLLNVLVARRRREAGPPVHWLVLAEWHLRLLGRGIHVTPADAVLRRVAEVCGMVPISLRPEATPRRARALRELRRLALRGRVVAFFPEGHEGRAGPLGQPLPGAGRFLSWMARGGVTVIPVALHEAGGRLVVAIGEPLGGPRGAGLATAGDAPAAREAMASLAALLPAPYQGRWAG